MTVLSVAFFLYRTVHCFLDVDRPSVALFLQSYYQAYQIGLANNFLQADEVRYKEDLKPLGFNFIRLGLQDVLLDPKTNTIYTPNTNQTTMFGQNVNQQVADSMIEETEQRWDGQRRESNGQFGKGKRPRSAQSKRKKNGSDKSSERLEKSDKSDMIRVI